MASITKENVIEVLNTVIEKQRGKSIYEMGLVTHIDVKDDDVAEEGAEPPRIHQHGAFARRKVLPVRDEHDGDGP